jgi:molybdopterin/thiamine biosynthesis adenylyltransferase
MSSFFRPRLKSAFRPDKGRMYSRFTALKNHSKEDQEKLEDSTAAVIGLGATGSAIAENLARHGVNLILIDRDYLEEKDAYSSSLYTLEQCRKSLPKAEAAEENLQEFTEVESYSISLSPENLEKISSADVILDGTDNLETRQLINDYSKREDIPWIYTAAIAERSYSMPFIDKCFNCIVQKPEKVATCETDGILREVAQAAAARSSQKAVKFLTEKNINEELELVEEGRALDVESSGCEVCRTESFPHIQREKSTAQVCGAGKFQLQKDFSRSRIESLEVGDKIAENDFLVRLEYEGREATFFDSGRVVVEAEDKGHAEALVSEIAGI